MGKWRWGVIVDAGSSGSRVHVYRWKDPSRALKSATAENKHSLPKIKTKWTKKIRPGVSTFGENPSEIGAAHLQSLIDYALEIVPRDMVADTPIFVMATAGMRLLPQVQQTALLREMCSYLQQHTSFALAECGQNIQVISGETEGLYGWLAANYLLGGFDHPEKHIHGQNHHTYGFLDMGGASAQIAFAPNSTEAARHADDLKLVRLRTLDGKPEEHRVFTATWLGYGVNEARETYVQTLTDRYYEVVASGGDVPDPCMPKGLRTTLEGEPVAGAKRGDASMLVGTGDFTRCLVGTKPLLTKQDKSCGDGSHPCLIHDSVPQLDFNINHFIGVSEYYHSTQGFFGGKGDQAYDFNTYQQNVVAFCDRDWSTIAADLEVRKNKNKNKHKEPERELQEAQQACFKASWVINVLHEGIGIPRVGLDKLPGFNVSREAAEAGLASTPFRPVDKIDSVEVSWTLGRILLYAAGQVPPSTSSGSGGKELAVGFGSNVLDGSIPKDFTYAGSTWQPLKSGGGSGGGDDDDDWGDDLLESARKKPASGLLALVLILVIVGFLLRKRERRARLLSRAAHVGSFVMRRSRWSGGSPRKPGGRHGLSSFTSKIFGGGHWYGSHEYERVLEEGQLMDQFELGDVESDDSNEILSSGGSTNSDGVSSSSAARLARTSGLATPQIAVGDVFDDARGLVVSRTESRERLTPNLQMLNAGRRSRAGSPTRLKSPMTPLSED